MVRRVLLFTDVVDSTALVERVGDAGAAELFAAHDLRARALLASHGGQEIDRTDGFFLLFDEAMDAARYAIAYHQALVDLALSARVGIHAGPVILRANTPEAIARGAKPMEVEGLSKPLAARVMALASGGQTLLSADARAALGNVLPEGSEIESHGHYRLKGVREPVELFELGARESAPFSPPPDTDKCYRVVRAGDLWRPGRTIRHNLPAERDAFVGRRTELSALADRLDSGARLLTVLGPGGTGKTRFVRRYAWTWLGDWPGGVYFCDLAEARSLEGIYFAVASGLQVPLGKDDPAVQLGHAIAGRGRCLVILDNFEQVVEHAGATVGGWLDRAGEAAIVVTSRERLQLPGEQVFTIEPLPVAREAVELFVARARAQLPDFALTASNRDAVARIAALLDGLPLAIELAAARVRVLSPAQIVEHMHDRFALLAGSRGAAARQATLRAAIDWSWDLLAPWEQAALAQCSVFDTGFTLEAAQAVLDLTPWPQAPATMDAVQALVDKSLLRAWLPNQERRYDIDEPHFGMYLSIREYAAHRLDAAGTDARSAAEHAHGRHFATFGSDAAIEAYSRVGGVRRLQALVLDLDNLVSACRRATARGDGGIAVANYRAAWEVLERQGPFTLGITLGERVLALDRIDRPARVDALLTCARASERAGHPEDAQVLLDEAMALTRAMSDRRREGVVLGLIGGLYREQGRMADAQPCLEQSLALHREFGNRFGEARVRQSLGNLHDQLGRPVDSRAHHEAGLAIYRELGDRRAEGHALAGLAILDRHQGRLEPARANYEAALAIHRELADRRGEGIALGNLGNVYLDQGDSEGAKAHYQGALVIHREVGSRTAEAYALANLGLVQRNDGRLEEAQSNLREALAISREVRDRYHEPHVLGCLGGVSLLQGRTDMARAYYDEALQANRATGNRRAAGVVLGCLAELMIGEQGLAEARNALCEGEALLREADDPLELAALLSVRARVELAVGDREAATATLTEVEAIAATLDTGPDSSLSRGIGKLHAALAAPEP